MKVIKETSEIKACCASCNGSGYSGGVDGFAKVVKTPTFALFMHKRKQKVA